MFDQLGSAVVLPDWLSPFAAELFPGYGEFVAHEVSAERLLIFSSTIIPGILQTQLYAKRSIEVHISRLSSETGRERLLKLRLKRQWSIFERSNPPTINVILEEAALRRNLAGHAIMKEQLLHIRELVDAGRITLQIIRFDAPNVPVEDTSSFVICQNGMSFLTSFEMTTGQQNLYDPTVCRMYCGLFDKFSEIADDQTTSMRFLDDLIANYYV